MVKLPAGLQRPILLRVAVYATTAALVTTALFAADAGYRWYRSESTEAAVPLTSDRAAPPASDRIVAAPELAPAETLSAKQLGRRSSCLGSSRPPYRPVRPQVNG